MDEASQDVTAVFRSSFGDTTVIHPLALTLVLAVLVAMAFVRRQYIPALLFLIAVFVSTAQRFVVLQFDFSMLRILGIGGMAICLLRRDLQWIRFGWLDFLIVAGVVARIVCQFLLWDNLSVTIRWFGLGIELLTLYVILRACIRSVDDLRVTIRMLGLITIAAMPFFLLELSTGRNMFSVFGGVPEMTEMREGALRCQGAFSHPILAGCFFATLLPLWIAVVAGRAGLERLIAVMAVVSALAIVYASASSTPVMVAVLGFLAWLVFPLRKWSRYLFLMTGLGLVGLHLAMKAPVWHLISRINLVAGNTGDHRFRLIDAAIDKFGSWWLYGTKETASWGPGLFDITNQFIYDGVIGGVWGTIALVLQIALAFFAVGAVLRALQTPSRRDRAGRRGRGADELLVFGFGVVIFVQIATFLSVTYFGQTVMLWQLTLAVAASLRQTAFESRRVVPSSHASRRRLRDPQPSPAHATARSG